MKKGIHSIPNQLFHHSPPENLFNGKVTAYLDIQELYDHRYGNIESVPY